MNKRIKIVMFIVIFILICITSNYSNAAVKEEDFRWDKNETGINIYKPTITDKNSLFTSDLTTWFHYVIYGGKESNVQEAYQVYDHEYENYQSGENEVFKIWIPFELKTLFHSGLNGAVSWENNNLILFLKKLETKTSGENIIGYLDLSDKIPGSETEMEIGNTFKFTDTSNWTKELNGIKVECYGITAHGYQLKIIIDSEGVRKSNGELIAGFELGCIIDYAVGIDGTFLGELETKKMMLVRFYDTHEDKWRDAAVENFVKPTKEWITDAMEKYAQIYTKEEIYNSPWEGVDANEATSNGKINPIECLILFKDSFKIGSANGVDILREVNVNLNWSKFEYSTPIAPYKDVRSSPLYV